jgi:KaiC/GvpD/RAD55 family RecA-like ATPase
MAFDIREHLDKLEPHPREAGKFFCPACGGHNLSVNLENGAYTCWSDDTKAHRALIRDNLSPAKLEPTRPSPGSRGWNYVTIDGRVVSTVKRIDSDVETEPKKVWRPFNDESLQDEVTPLYWAECIEQFTREGGRVFLVEGEMCADEMRALGLNAITFIGGCTGYKKERYYDLLYQIRDALVLVPDMDKLGMKLMDGVAHDFPEALWCYTQGPNHYYWGADRLPENGGYDIADAIRNGADVDRIVSWIHRRQSFALTGQALEADVEVTAMLEGLQRIYTDTLDVAVREVKIGQYLKTSGLKDLGWTIQRAMKHCACQQFNTGVIEVVDSHDLMTAPTKRPRWIIPGFLPAASVVLLGAGGGSGKTTLCYQLAKHIATGEQWSDFPVVKGKVLIISTDESSHDTKEKLQTIDYANVPRGGVSFIRFWRFTQVDLLEDKIRQLEPSLVIIDSLTSTTAGIGADRTSSSAGDCLYELRDIAEKYECSFIVLHHLNKNDEFRDSTTYVDNVSEAWMLTKDPERRDDFILTYKKSRSSFQGRAVLRRKLEGYKWTLEGRLDTPCDWNVEQRAARFVNDQIRADGVENWLTAEQIAARATGLTNTEVHSALPVLRLTGRIQCDTSIHSGRTIRRYAAWDAKRVAPESGAIIQAAIESPLVGVDNAFDDLLLMIRQSMNEGVAAEQMFQILETYEWDEGEKARLWDALDDDMKAYIRSGSG